MEQLESRLLLSSFELIDLPPTSYPIAVSEDGSTVYGRVADNAGWLSAYKWSKSGGLEKLGGIATGILNATPDARHFSGFSNSNNVIFNTDGTIVDTTKSPVWFISNDLSTRTGEYVATEAGPLRVAGISSSGATIAGNFDYAPYGPYAVNTTGHLQKLDDCGRATSVSPNGQFVGGHDCEGAAAIWATNGQKKSFPEIPHSYVAELSEDGRIAVVSGDHDPETGYPRNYVVSEFKDVSNVADYFATRGLSTPLASMAFSVSDISSDGSVFVGIASHDPDSLIGTGMWWVARLNATTDPNPPPDQPPPDPPPSTQTNLSFPFGGVSWTVVDGGIDIRFRIDGAPLPNAADIHVYWGSAGEPIGAPVFSYTIPSGSQVGEHSLIPISALQLGPPPGASEVLVVLDADGVVSESDEVDNLAMLPIPDLAISGSLVFTLRETGPVSETIVAAYDVLHADVVRDFTVAFNWAKNGVPQTKDGPNNFAPPTLSIPVTAAATKSIGNHTIYLNQEQYDTVLAGFVPGATELLVRIDPPTTSELSGGKVIERSESNNTQSATIPSIEVIVTHGWNPWASLDQDYDPSSTEWVNFRADFVAIAQSFKKGVAQVESLLADRINSRIVKWDSTSGFSAAIFGQILAALNNAVGGIFTDNFLSSVATELTASGAMLADNIARKAALDALNAFKSNYPDPKTAPHVLLIGHSRGAAVNAELSKLLVKHGYVVRDFVSLDGHATDWPEPGSAITDLDIITAKGDHKLNYRVEAGLAEAAIPILLNNSLPSLISDFVGAILAWEFGDLRAPRRSEAGFIDVGIFETDDTESNHVNVVKNYLESPIKNQGKRIFC